MSSVSQQMMLGGVAPPASIVFQQFGNVSVVGPNVVTATAWALGPPALNRTVYALISWNNANGVTGPERPLTNVSIDAIPAAIIVQSGGNIGSYWAGCAIVAAQVPNDTTGDVVMTFQSGASFYNVWVATYSALGVVNPNVPVSTFGTITIGGATHTENLSVQSGGVVLSPMFLFWDMTSTVSGITRDYNTATGSFVTEGGNAQIASDNAAYPITANVSGSTNFLMVGASFR